MSKIGKNRHGMHERDWKQTSRRQGKEKDIRYSEDRATESPLGWCVPREDYRVHEKKVRRVSSPATGVLARHFRNWLSYAHSGV